MPELAGLRQARSAIRDNPAVFLPRRAPAKSEVIDDLGADNAKYTKVWDEVKAAR